MNRALLKSLLRHLLGAVLTALGVVLATPADLTVKVALLTVAAAVVPVAIKYVDPEEPAFGRTDEVAPQIHL